MARKVNTFVRTSPNCFANAGYVVSGGAALLRLKDHRGIRIVKPAEFLTLLPLVHKRDGGFAVRAGGVARVNAKCHFCGRNVSGPTPWFRLSIRKDSIPP